MTPCPCCGYAPRQDERPDMLAVLVELERLGVLSTPVTLEQARLIRCIFESAERGEKRLQDAVGISRHAANRRLRGTGLKPYAWMLLARTFYATLRLQSGERLKDIAAACGHADQFSFSHAISRDTSYRPTHIRELNGWRPVIEAFVTRRKH